MIIEADVAVIKALPDFPLCHMEMVWVVEVEVHAVVEVEARLVVAEIEALQSFPSWHMGIILVMVVVETKAPGLRRIYSCSPHLIPLYVGVPRPALSRVPGALPWQSI